MHSRTWIAELRVVIVHPDGRRVPGRIAVGQPYTLGAGDPSASDESHCPVEIDSLWSREHPIVGGGTLHALVLALQFLGTLLNDFVRDGGRVLDAEEGTDIPLGELFGSLLLAREALPTIEPQRGRVRVRAPRLVRNRSDMRPIGGRSGHGASSISTLTRARTMQHGSV